MRNTGDALERLLAPEYGQAEEVQSEEVDSPEIEDEDLDDGDEEEYDDGDGEEYDDEDDSDDEDSSDEGEQEPEVVPLSRYNELRKFATQKSMQLAELKKSMLNTTQPQEQQVQVQPQSTPQAPPKGQLANSLEAIVESKVNAKLEAYLAPIREQEAEINLQTAIIAIAERDKDFGDVSPLFLKQLEAAPQLFEMENGIELAYKAAKAEYLEKVTAARVKAQTQEALKRKVMKENITEGASYTRPQQQKARSEADMIKESIMELGVRKTF